MYDIKVSSVTTVMHVSLVYVCILVVGLGTTPTLSQPEEDGPLEYYILEELTEGTLIGNVAVDAKLTDRYDRATLAQLQYSFLGEGGDGQKYFALDERSGMVRTRTRIDRDTICPHELTCYVWLDVAVQPPQFFQVIKMKVDILDVNDHEPRFPQRSIELLIPESAPSGSVYPLPTATDPDSGSYGVQDYQLVTSNNRFELQATRNPIDGSVDLKLVLRKHLDRERDGYHQLIVVAKDGGAPPKTGTVSINVTVEDMNDNDPIFTNASYEVFVLENVAAGSTITRVSANDADSGANGQIIYSFADSTLQKYGRVFGLNNATGRIYLKIPLDFESASTYLLTVIGRDQGPGSRLGRAVVVVRVRDDNDNVPKITVNSLTTSGVAQASETAPPGTFVAHVSVTDADSGNNGKVTCFVSYARDHFKLVPLYTSQYKLITDSRLDREATDQYWVMITCHDHGNPQNSANKNITVRVMDENDHEPVFSQNIYTSELLENNYIGAAIVKLNATDMDSENNGQVRFKVEQDWEGRINVQPITGQVSAGDVFDREQVDQISFDVVAYDLGKPSRSSTAKVIVDILDVNDEIPQFTHRTYSLGVFENEPAGTDVGNVKAEDRDIGINSQFDYVIVDSDTDANRWFTIDPKSGRIITKVVFDREQVTTYRFRVRAANTGYPPMSSTAQVTVYIADRNDNSPIFEFPTDLNYTVYTSNMVPVGDIITRVIVHDIDSGANKKLTHYLISGNDDNIFQLDSQTGELAIGTSMMSIKYKVYNLRVVVKDGGHPPQRTSADLRVVVNHSIAFHQANEQPPTLSRDTLTIIVAMSFAGLILIIVVCLAVCVIIKRSRHAKKHSGKYSCRNERERMLSALDDRERQRQYAETGGGDPAKSPLNQKDCKQKYEPDMGDMDDYKKHVAEENEKQDSRFIISVSPSKDYMKNKSPAHLPQKPDLTRSHVVYMRADGDRSSTGSDHTSSADSGRGHSDGETHRYTLQPVDSPEPDLRVSDEEEVFIPLSRALRHQRL